MQRMRKYSETPPSWFLKTKNQSPPTPLQTNIKRKVLCMYRASLVAQMVKNLPAM